MNRDRISLMTFPLQMDVLCKKMTLTETLRLAADAGLPTIDLYGTGKGELLRYQQAMAETGVGVYCYITALSFFSGEQALLRGLHRELSKAKALGAKLFMIVPYLPVIDRRRAAHLGRAATLDRMVQGFALAVAAGQAYGLTVCFETTPQDAICLSGAEDCLYVLERVPGLGLVFDTANVLPHGDEPLAALERLRPYIIHVHLKDVALVPRPFSLLDQECSADGRLMEVVVWGKGVVPIQAIYDRLIFSGYDGKFALEYARPQAVPCPLAVHAQQVSRFLTALREPTDATP
jgi:sugar phosphate isomerase/epimerase